MFGIYAGDTDKTIYVRLRDSTTGLAKTGIAYNSAGAVASYTLPGAARAAITLATQTVTGAHSDGGFVEVDATNCKGLYRLDLPDAAIASGAFSIISIEFDGVIEESVLVPLLMPKVNVKQISDDGTAADNLESACDNYSATRGLAGTALPNAAADAAGGLPISDAGGLDLDTKLANTNEITVARMGALTDWIDGGRLDLLLDDIPNTAEFEARTLLANGYFDHTTDEVIVGSLSTAAKAEVNAEIDQALADYDGPTNAEMEARTLVAASYATAANLATVDTVVDAIKAAIVVAEGTVATGTSSVQFVSDLSSTTDSWPNDQVLVFTTGALAGQSRPIFSYTGSSKTFVVSEGFTGTPQAGDAFKVLSFHVHTTTAVATAVWANATRVLTAGTNIALAKGTGVTGFNDLDAAGIRTAVGLASANLDTQLGDLPTATENADAVLARAVENVEDTADRHSLAALVMIATNSSVSGTTLTVNKPSDDSTFATYTLTASAGADPVTGIS